ncbi:MAG: glycosyltransferase family A protein, partial [Salinivirgaceae bacterium]|nr:glycosyltransferase family A protein [Salinivirgaceae bacterium]
MSDEEVFIGVPVYNGGKYLEECLDSILNQTYKKWVCYISNNHSKDNTQKIIDAYCEKDKRFKAIKPKEFI